MTARFTLEMPEDLLTRVDEARGDVPRNAWIRRQVEWALGQPYRQSVPGPNVENVRSSAQSKRDTRPYPKRGKR